MAPQRKNAGGSAARTARRERAQEELDRMLDQALECTFPASDPFQLSNLAPVPSEAAEARNVRRGAGAPSRRRISKKRSTTS
jgi:hypothetical protein